MKHWIIIAALLSTGCSTIGGIEGTGRAGEISRAITKTNSVLTGQRVSVYNTGKINRALGHIRNINVSEPNIYALRDVFDLLRYYP
jgi:hypothetical protein